MTRLTNTALSRRFALLLGAVAISGIALAAPAPAEAKSKFDIDIHIGSGFGYGYGGGYYGGPCKWFLHKYLVTGKYYWKKKYYKCVW